MGIQPSTSDLIFALESGSKIFLSQFSFFFFFYQLYSIKNVEKAYFDQHLECAAPKRWLKYKTLKNILVPLNSLR